ncbi:MULTISPECIES: posphoenolpyruvate synthetase regulatory kinase/phosphorylase PpsR [Legionella]|uniref:Putative phosphoenolpyruvate synthase regulatory protein n=1 Tax=Legionella septentrionalis TaxID=2498109 RepID=A0A3S0WZG8_9GAMM|nr:MULTISPECIES: pyruvate, water dikinase regulatory protein [Legionella]MCP0913276.1 kinase/pyrophosphorylase [Legionella sp. 27cVA30]RUQ82089.1 kinase/pyrophosphorylase [Legionella septentrionalis]RUQ95532.1 kinase/pyrophosphorylase [Legionella septentrionalis]RUR08930.1 kinase/pyrophosphorylase [Legionella septentrionalis]RUR14716.1 kinase/pyrophosphorylase [Legionella septentrionalis]
MKRYIFMVSDGTGITAESLGNSLLTQFEQIQFEKQTIPYVDSIEKAEAVINKINHCYEETGIKPIVFLTLVNPEISAHIKNSKASIYDLFNTFLAPLEQELNTKSSYTVGRTHGVSDTQSYNQRIEAVNYTLAHDDGIKIKDYDKADIVLIGVSRCGKTPSCLYMALQFGILAANYPFAEEELADFRLPDVLRPYKHKLFGLTIDPQRLQHIRTERRPNSQYASTEQCRREIAEVEAMYKQENIPFINSTRYSIEEITTKIMATAGIKRKI